VEEKIKQAFEIADYMSVLSNQKNILKEEFKQNLLYYQNGGSFTLSREFISFLKLLLDLGQIENVILVDDNSVPINIVNLKDFFDRCLSAYTEAVNEYYTRYTQLVKNRKIESLVDIS
jgi:hypothetical protein